MKIEAAEEKCQDYERGTYGEINETLDILMFREGSWWVGQCVQYDIAVQEKTQKKLKIEMDRVISAYIILSIQLKQPVFKNVPSAPYPFWNVLKKMYQTDE